MQPASHPATHHAEDDEMSSEDELEDAEEKQGEPSVFKNVFRDAVAEAPAEPKNESMAAMLAHVGDLADVYNSLGAKGFVGTSAMSAKEVTAAMRKRIERANAKRNAKHLSTGAAAVGVSVGLMFIA